MSSLPIPGPTAFILPLLLWFVLTLVLRHPGVAAIVAAFLSAIFFPLIGG